MSAKSIKIALFIGIIVSISLYCLGEFDRFYIRGGCGHSFIEELQSRPDNPFYYDAKSRAISQNIIDYNFVQFNISPEYNDSNRLASIFPRLATPVTLSNSSPDTIYFLSSSCDGHTDNLKYEASEWSDFRLLCNVNYPEVCTLPPYEKIHFEVNLYPKAIENSKKIRLGYHFYPLPKNIDSLMLQKIYSHWKSGYENENIGENAYIDRSNYRAEYILWAEIQHNL